MQRRNGSQPVKRYYFYKPFGSDTTIIGGDTVDGNLKEGRQNWIDVLL